MTKTRWSWSVCNRSRPSWLYSSFASLVVAHGKKLHSARPTVVQFKRQSRTELPLPDVTPAAWRLLQLPRHPPGERNERQLARPRTARSDAREYRYRV